jgi:hypothetical protein
MRLINPAIFRLGQTDRWNSDTFNLNKSVSLTSTTLQATLQNYLGNTFNLFIIKTGVVDNSRRDVVEVHSIFYKYIQLRRMVKSFRLAWLIAVGAFKNKPPLYHVRLAQGFVVPATLVLKLESLLAQSFGQNFRLHFYNISQIADSRYSKLDKNLRSSIDFFMRGQQKRLEMSKGERSWPPLESNLEAQWLNPLKIRDSYSMYKSYSSLAYSLDVLLGTLYTCIYNSSNLLADIIIRGLLRNMKKHKQFLALLRVTIKHYSTFHNWPYKPLDWCIAFNGKIGSGTARSRTLYIKTGYLPLQSINFPVDYSYRQANTKFGSIGVKVWLRRLQ